MTEAWSINRTPRKNEKQLCRYDDSFNKKIFFLYIYLPHAIIRIIPIIILPFSHLMVQLIGIKKIIPKEILTRWTKEV